MTDSAASSGASAPSQGSAQGDGRAAAPRVHARVRDLLRLIGNAALANRGLVVLILVVGFINAFLQKAPFVLLGPMLDVASGGGGNSFAWLTGPVESFADQIRDWVGLDFDPASVSPIDDDTGRRLSEAELVAKQASVDRAITLCLGCAAIAMIAGLFGALAIYGTLVLTRFFATKIVVDLRNRLAAHLLGLPLRFYGQRRMGDLLSNLTNDTQVLSRSFTLACDHVVMDPLLVLANMGLIIIAMPQAIWVLFLILPIMAFPLVRLGRKVHKRSSRSLAAMGDAVESMNQMLSGIKTVKAFQLEEQRLRDFEASNQRYLDRTKSMLKAKASSQASTSAIYTVAFAVMMFGFGWWLSHGQATLGQLALVGMGLGTTYQHVKRLARAYNTLMESVGALEGVQAVMQEKSEAAVGVGVAVDRLSGKVVFDDVGFSYDSTEVLRNVSAEIEPGQVVALVGPTGAGKSTVVDLLLRFYNPTHGRILIDGQDLQQIELESYRRHLAVVTQSPFLFNASILENIRHGRPEASMDEIIDAARAAQIHDFIASLDDGYDAVVGERGSRLSGGQMQRITIARALLRDPAILLLDEATSALDSESEGAVQTALQNLMRGRTSFVVAHRLSTIFGADRILVLQEGRVVETGTHADLLAAGGLYARLVSLQQVG